MGAFLKKETEKKKKTVLVIDDEESMNDSCSQILNREGYSIFNALDAEHGMSLLREKRPDLILLDLKLPGKSGSNILPQILMTDPTVVIVVITGYATVESAVEAMKLGASDFLPKPFTPDELRMIVKRGLEKRSLLVKTKRLEEENTRIRDNFVSIITHEMRSPLVAVEQYIEVLVSGITGEMQEKHKDILLKSKRRIKWLLSLINEWLSIARIQDNIILERITEVDISSILNEALELVYVQAEEKNINLEFDMPEKAPVIIGNYEVLVHLFMNLYSNAIKYNRKNGRIISKVCEKSDSISVTISDTGIGIPPESLPFIFDEFFRVRLRIQKNQQLTGETGTGLGLAIVKKIVDAHKGYITVESQEEIGTSFTIHLPKNLTGVENCTTGINGVING